MSRPADPDAYLKLLADDFKFFLQELWQETGNYKHAPLEELDLDIAEFVSDTTKTAKVVLAFRGKGKTTFGACAYSAFRQYQSVYYGDTQFRIKMISKSHGFAVNAISMIREWFSSVWFLKHLAPSKDQEKNHRDNRESFDIGPSTRTKDPSVSAAGIDGQITGTRAHLLISDDSETPDNVKTVNSREWLRESVKEFRQIASFGNREIIYFGTPHSRESLYDHLATKEIEDPETKEIIRYEVRSWPIILPEPKWVTKHTAPLIRERLAELGREVKPGELIPTCPVNFPRRIILERLAEGEINFARQSMLVADCADLLYPLRLSDLIVPDFEVPRDEGPTWIKWGRTRAGGVSNVREDLQLCGMSGDVLLRPFEVSPNSAKWSRTIMRVDPSGRGEDQTAWGVASGLAGWVWIKALKGDGHQKDKSGDDPRVIRQIAEDARYYGATEIIVEQQFGGTSFGQLLEVEVQKLFLNRGGNPDTGGHPDYPDGWRCSVIIEHSKGQKERRIVQSLSSPMSNHKVVIAEDAIRLTPGLPVKYELQYQISNLTEQVQSLDKDDKVEVLAGLVSYFAEDLRVTPEQIEEKLAKERLESQLQEHYAAFRKQKPAAWSTRLA